MKTTTFRIEGMRCETCADTIKMLLGAAEGVRAAEVSFKDGAARVLYEPEALSKDPLAALIEKPGYRVLALA